MANLKKQAKQARKQFRNLDLASVKQHLPTDFDVSDLHFIRKREDEAASRGFVSGFLLGALVGAVIALIFAPKRGDETRGIVADAAGDIKEKATDLVHQVRHESDKVDGDAMKAAATDAKSDLQATLDEAAAKTEGTVAQAWSKQE